MEKRTNSDRRKEPTSILSRYTVSGRRRAFRRRKDQEKAGYIDRYDYGLLIWALTLFALNIVDAAMTHVIVDRGGYEVNPFMRWLMKNWGNHFISWKLAVISVAIILVCLHSKFRKVKPLFYFSILVYIIVVIYQMILISGS